MNNKKCSAATQTETRDDSRTSRRLGILVSIPVTFVAAFSLAADSGTSSLQSISGSSFGQSISGSSFGQSISGSSFYPSSVYVIGLVSGSDDLAGTITVGDVVVYASSANTYGSTSLGSLVYVVGMQPGSGNLLIAESITSVTSDLDEAVAGNLMSISGSSFSGNNFR